MKIRCLIMRARQARLPRPLAVLLAVAIAVGCTGPREYLRNGFKVGPNYSAPEALVSSKWIETDEAGRVATPPPDKLTPDEKAELKKNKHLKNAYPTFEVTSNPADLSKWWHIFQDPLLDSLMLTAYEQNLDLQTAAARVLRAQALRAIAVGNLFPQSQTLDGSYSRNQVSRNQANAAFLMSRFFDNWQGSLQATWELDFWGRYRRGIENADAELDASIYDYDTIMVTLAGDVASEYVLFRTLQKQIQYLRTNVDLQEKLLELSYLRWQGGKDSEIPYQQSKANYEQTRAQIPPLEAQVQQAANRLCVLLGMPPYDLLQELGLAPIPVPPPEVAIGVPADLIRRRPDVRAFERRVAAQSAVIGIAESDLYPSIFLNGVIGVQAEHFGKLFESQSMFASVGPSFQWNVLNYGRILNNVRAQDAEFQARVFTYQQRVLAAGQEVESALIGYLKAHEQARDLQKSVDAYERSYRLTADRFEEGKDDFTPVLLVQIFMIEQQLFLAQAQGDIALNLVQTYRALGGGWDAPFPYGVGPDGQPLSGPCELPGVESAPLPRLVPEPVPATGDLRPSARQEQEVPQLLPRALPVRTPVARSPGTPPARGGQRKFIIPAAYSNEMRSGATRE